MEGLNRQGVMQIIEQRLKELRLDSLFEIFVREHNPLDGTHKGGIGASHSHDDRYYTETEIDAVLDMTNMALKTTIQASAYMSAAQSNIADDSWLTVQCDKEYFDPGSNYNTNKYTFTTPTPGRYLVLGQAKFSTLVSDKRYGVGIYNSTDSDWCAFNLCPIGTAPASMCLGCAGKVSLEANKALLLKAYQNTGGALVDLDADETRWSVHLLSV